MRTWDSSNYGPSLCTALLWLLAVVHPWKMLYRLIGTSFAWMPAWGHCCHSNIILYEYIHGICHFLVSNYISISDYPQLSPLASTSDTYQQSSMCLRMAHHLTYFLLIGESRQVYYSYTITFIVTFECLAIFQTGIYKWMKFHISWFLSSMNDIVQCYYNTNLYSCCRYYQCGPVFVFFIFHQSQVIFLDPKDAKVHKWYISCLECDTWCVCYINLPLHFVGGFNEPLYVQTWRNLREAWLRVGREVG